MNKQELLDALNKDIQTELSTDALSPQHTNKYYEILKNDFGYNLETDANDEVIEYFLHATVYEQLVYLKDHIVPKLLDKDEESRLDVIASIIEMANAIQREEKEDDLQRLSLEQLQERKSLYLPLYNQKVLDDNEEEELRELYAEEIKNHTSYYLKRIVFQIALSINKDADKSNEIRNNTFTGTIAPIVEEFIFQSLKPLIKENHKNQK